MLEMWMCALQNSATETPLLIWWGEACLPPTLSYTTVSLFPSCSWLFNLRSSEFWEQWEKSLPQCSEVIKSVILSEPYYWNHLFFPLPWLYSGNKFSGHVLVVRATLLEMNSRNIGWHKKRQMPEHGQHSLQPQIRLVTFSAFPPLGHVPLGNFLLILGECSFHGNLGLNMYLQTQPVCLDFGCYFPGRWCWKCHYQDESSMIELFGYGEKVSSASIVPFMKWTLKLSQFNI